VSIGFSCASFNQTGWSKLQSSLFLFQKSDGRCRDDLSVHFKDKKKLKGLNASTRGRHGNMR
jgi:hypothetical protein